MTTINLVTDASVGTPSEFVSISGGAYFLAATSSGDTPPLVDLILNIGSAKSVSLFGNQQEMSTVRTVVLPDCTVRALVSGGVTDSFNVSLAYIGPAHVVTKESENTVQQPEPV